MMEYILIFNEKSGISHGYVGKKPSKDFQEFIPMYFSAIHYLPSDIKVLEGRMYDYEYKLFRSPYTFGMVKDEGIFYWSKHRKISTISFISQESLSINDLLKEGLSYPIEDELAISGEDYSYLNDIVNSFEVDSLKEYRQLWAKIRKNIDGPFFKAVVNDYMDRFYCILKEGFREKKKVKFIIEQYNEYSNQHLGNSLYFYIGLSNHFLKRLHSTLVGEHEFLFSTKISDLKDKMSLHKEIYDLELFFDNIVPA